jgi:hypothetical protein
LIADLELYQNKGLCEVEPGLILVILRITRILWYYQKKFLWKSLWNFFSLENNFPYDCADFFFSLSDYRYKTKGKLWGLFNIDGVPFCERKNMFCKVLFDYNRKIGSL